VAWLHEVLEWTAVTEQELLIAGLTSDELRALRLLDRTTDSHSDRRYLAHLELIARATGDSGRLARIVKTADLKDRSLHPHVRRDGWSPPYARALKLLSEARDDPHRAGTAAVPPGHPTRMTSAGAKRGAIPSMDVIAMKAHAPRAS